VYYKMVPDTWLPHPVTEGLRMLVKCGERVGTKVLKVLNMRMCKITDEVGILNLAKKQTHYSSSTGQNSRRIMHPQLGNLAEVGTRHPPLAKKQPTFIFLREH
jgi:hypothetical protein